MLLLHEVHTVAGKQEDEFEAAFRDPGGCEDLGLGLFLVLEISMYAAFY